MKTFSFWNLVVIAALLVFTSSCSDDDEDPKNQTSIKFTASYPSTKSSTVNSGVSIERFKINIEEIEIEFDDEEPLFTTDSVATDYEFEGPFEVDLMDAGNTLQTTVARRVELPAAAYEEIEFKFRESEVTSSEMFEKSILIEGEINGVPFVFWSDEEIEVEIEFENLVYIDEAKVAILTISFDLGALFDTSKGGIDISSATDGNGDGVIQIHPDNPDGNDDLSDSIWNKIEDIIEAFEED